MQHLNYRPARISKGKKWYISSNFWLKGCGKNIRFMSFDIGPSFIFEIRVKMPHDRFVGHPQRMKIPDVFN